MRRCFTDPPLLEEPCAQTLSGKMFMPNSARKCDAKVLPTNSTIQKSVNPTVTSLIHSYLFGGKIKHAY